MGLSGCVSLGRFLQCTSRHAPADLQRVARMDAEEYPQDLGLLGARPYPFQVVVFLVLPEAALQPAGPFPGDGARQLPALFFVFAGPALSLEIGADTVLGGETPVFIGRIDGIGTGQLRPGPGEPLGGEDGIDKAVALMEGIKT